MSIVIRPVSGKTGIREFVTLPFDLYRDSKYWVPPIIKGEMQTLDPATNPAHHLAETALWIAYKNGKPAGRLAAIALRTVTGTEGRFGWFDVVDDLEVSRALFDTAGEWLRSRGADQIKGPMGYTNLDKAGMLIAGFDELPTIATIYNYSYYNDHMAALGFEKSTDYVEYEFKVPAEIPAQVTSFVDVISKRYGLRLVHARNVQELQPYGQQLFELINETHRNLYGFTLLNEEMKQYYIRKYMPYMKPDFIALVVNAENKLVAYALTMPSFSEALQKARGKLYPFGFLHFLRAGRTVRRADLMLIGVSDALRNKGVTSLIFHKLITNFKAYGVQRVESNPELETNQQVHALWHKYEHRLHKRRRIYQRDLT